MRLTLPKDKSFIENLVLQRTNRFIELGGANALNHWVKTGEKTLLYSYLIEKNLLQEYIKRTIKDIEVEADQVTKTIGTPFLNNASFVSIGPGNCIFEAILYKMHLKSMAESSHPNAIILVDIENTENLHKHMFHSQGSGYSSLQASKAFLKKNEVITDIFLCNPQKDELPTCQYDILISLYSMGFHYPLTEYMEFLLTKPSDNAVIVFDSRHGYNSKEIEKLTRTFSVMKELNFNKWKRIFLKKIIG